MKIQTTISVLTAAAIALASFSAVAQGRHGQSGAQAQDRAQIERGQKDIDRDRLRDRDRISPARDRDRIQDQDRTHVPDKAKLGEKEIYGGEFMSAEERNQYREQLRLTESDPKARTKFMAEHQEKMQARAKAQGVALGDPAFAAKQGNGIYGNELMSVQERNQYREQLRLTESDPKARTQFMAQHQEKMQARAKAQGVALGEPAFAGNQGSGIYGNELMSVQERNQYREQLRLTESDPQARTQFKAQHQERMQARAKEMGVDIETVPEVEEAE